MHLILHRISSGTYVLLSGMSDVGEPSSIDPPLRQDKVFLFPNRIHQIYLLAIRQQTRLKFVFVLSCALPLLRTFFSLTRLNETLLLQSYFQSKHHLGGENIHSFFYYCFPRCGGDPVLRSSLRKILS